jgi:putative ABC transport system permease protein
MNYQLAGINDPDRYMDGLDAYVVPESIEAMSTIQILRDRLTHEPIPLTTDGVVITERMAELLNLKVGDVANFTMDGVAISQPITGVTENYTGHFIYVHPDLYRRLVAKEPVYNVTYISCPDDEFLPKVASTLTPLDAVAGVFYVQESLETFIASLKSLDVAVWVIIYSAAALAFAVSYNLNNITITERVRELASIKVLGYYNSQMTMYVLRENVFLIFLGIVVGQGFGWLLHRYVIRTVETNLVMFGRTASLNSMLYSVVLTVVFAIIVNWTAHFRIKRVNMLEALKIPD